MRNQLAAALTLWMTCFVTWVEAGPSGLPDSLEAQAAVLSATYPKIDGKRFPKAPADSAWVFRSANSAVGTVEVGFEGSDVVYMIFRRGNGGTNWKLNEIRLVHITYHEELLKETYSRFPETFSRYDHSIAAKIGAALITRKGFDQGLLLGGM